MTYYGDWTTEPLISLPLVFFPWYIVQSSLQPSKLGSCFFQAFGKCLQKVKNGAIIFKCALCLVANFVKFTFVVVNRSDLKSEPFFGRRFQTMLILFILHFYLLLILLILHWFCCSRILIKPEGFLEMVLTIWYLHLKKTAPLKSHQMQNISFCFWCGSDLD